MIRRLLAGLLIVLLVPGPLWAAVTYDTQTVNADINNDTSHSFNHTVGAGSDIAVVVCVSLDVASPSVTDVDVGGVQAVKVTDRATAGTRFLSMWVAVLGSSSGTKAIDVTWNDADNPKFLALSFHGVHQTTPTGTPQTATGSDQSSTTPSISGDVDGMFVDCFMGGTNLDDAAEGAGQTERIASLVDINSTYEFASTKVGAASTTFSWTWTGSSTNAHIGVGLLPAGAAAAGGGMRARKQVTF